jgi:hypothetical protein
MVKAAIIYWVIRLMIQMLFEATFNKWEQLLLFLAIKVDRNQLIMINIHTKNVAWSKFFFSLLNALGELEPDMKNMQETLLV